MAYTAPTLAEFQVRFPEFEDSEDEAVQFALDDAGRLVGQSWLKEGDYKAGIQLLAAHFLQVSGGAYDSGGLRSFSVGAISVTYADSKVLAELGTTSYGSRYMQLLKLNCRGPVVI